MKKTLTLLTLGIITAQTSAWAAPAQVKASKPLESYSATDGEEPQVMQSKPKSITPAKTQAKALPVQKKVSLEMRVDTLEKEIVELRRRGNSSAPTAQQTSAPSYDDIPEEQVESISDRIKLVEDILRKHGRAYDYRAHTAQNLKTILAQLDSDAAEKEASAEDDLELDIPTESDESDNS